MHSYPFTGETPDHGHWTAAGNRGQPPPDAQHLRLLADLRIRLWIHSDHLRWLCERGHLRAGQVRGQQVRRLLPPVTVRTGECHPAAAGGAARRQQKVSERDVQR